VYPVYPDIAGYSWIQWIQLDTAGNSSIQLDTAEYSWIQLWIQLDTAVDTAGYSCGYSWIQLWIQLDTAVDTAGYSWIWASWPLFWGVLRVSTLPHVGQYLEGNEPILQIKTERVSKPSYRASLGSALSRAALKLNYLNLFMFYSRPPGLEHDPPRRPGMFP
jgi:hypothetical protein